MDSKRLYDKVMTIFGTTMVFFYMGMTYLLVFSPIFAYIDIALRVIFALPLFIYGVYRAVGAFRNIKENFFDSDDE